MLGVGIIFNFIEQKAGQENATIVHWENPHWKFGTAADCIQVGDVILLGIIFVSPGKVTPLLRLRSHYMPPVPFSLNYNLLP